MIGYILDLKKNARFFCVEVISPIGDVFFSLVLNYCTNQEIKIYNFWKKQHFGKIICFRVYTPSFHVWEMTC